MERRTELADGETHNASPRAHRSFTVRATVCGLAIGVLVNLSNTYYGLRIGVASQMSMVSGLLGFASFKIVSRYSNVPFSPFENVLTISVATATGAMPVTAGFVGAIPAIEYLIGPEDNGPIQLDFGKLVLWSVSLCLFGLVFASWLRPYFVDRQGLPWPGARATASLITTLHRNKPEPELLEDQVPQTSAETESGGSLPCVIEDHPLIPPEDDLEWASAARGLAKAACASALCTIVMFFVPILHELPIFGSNAKFWMWTVDLSPGFVGQGIITGLAIPLHMLFGAVVGWGILSPYAKRKGYAPGDIDDWETGSRGWIIWPSLAALLADATIKLGWVILHPLWKAYSGKMLAIQKSALARLKFTSTAIQHWQGYGTIPTDGTDDFLDTENVSTGSDLRDQIVQSGYQNTQRLAISGALLAIAVIMCCLAIPVVFNNIAPWYYTILAIALSLPMAVVGVRSLAETDYNPESAIVSQLVFASIIPHTSPNGMIMNLVSAAVAQAGANQSGDLSYDLKVGDLVGASPDAQTYGQLIGSIVGAVVSCAVYRLYASQYAIPGPVFRVPSSFLVLSTSRLLMGRGLPPGVMPFVVAAAVASAIATILKMRFKNRWWEKIIPSGVAFAIGIYNTPSFTITRALGGILFWAYKKHNVGGKGNIIVIASGLILGESLASLVTIAMTAAQVPQLGAH